MSRRRHLTGLSCAILAAGLALGACTDDGKGAPGGSATQATQEAQDAPVVQLGAPGEAGRELSDEEVAELGEGPPATAGDVAFVQGMVEHHRQALVMTTLVEENTTNGDVSLLAERLAVSQTDELGQLAQWLDVEGEELPPDHGDHGTGGTAGSMMPGMLDDAELERLASARRTAFDRLFLRFMIRHHEGAIVMVEQLLGSGEGGQQSRVFQIAQHVDSDQRVEIARMKRLLADR